MEREITNDVKGTNYGQYKTIEQARERMCPIEYTRDVPNPCAADDCLFWRWRPLLVSEPGYKEACAEASKMTKDERGDLTPAEYVNSNRDKYNLPSKPYLGYCGMAGRPDA